MGQQVGDGVVRTPAGLIEVEAILGETGEVDDAEVGAAGRQRLGIDGLQALQRALIVGGIGEVEPVGHVGVEGGRFAEVVEAGPDEFAGGVGGVVEPGEFQIGW